jgi:hypothetical protein
MSISGAEQSSWPNPAGQLPGYPIRQMHKLLTVTLEILSSTITEQDRTKLTVIVITVSAALHCMRLSTNK